MNSKFTLTPIWVSSVAMMGIVAIFDTGNSLVMMTPPLAATATSIVLIRSSKDSKERETQNLSSQPEPTKLLETQMAKLEADRD